MTSFWFMYPYRKRYGKLRQALVFETIGKRQYALRFWRQQIFEAIGFGGNRFWRQQVLEAIGFKGDWI